MMNQTNHKKAGLADIFKYAVGEGATSITMNGISNFAMVYLTQILSLAPTWAALAIGISIFWDAVTDPIMGHISDNTRSRWGRRHPYSLIGGLFTAVTFFLFWSVPQMLNGPVIIFFMALIINLLIRTAVTVFFVPFTALGFDICPEYESRSRLQGVRYFINQIVNFTFGALAWTLFFKDHITETGKRIDGSLIGSNYVVMGFVLAIFVALLASVCCFGTRNYAVDNRKEQVHGKRLADFWVDFSSIFKNRLAIRVFVFYIIVQFSMLLTSMVQMFAYIFYMQFTPLEKTCVHGGGMLAFALASLNLPHIVKRYDKKPAGYIGIGLAVFGGLSLLTVFHGGQLAPQQTIEFSGITFPVATIVFGLLQACWWGGCGMIVPLSSSMIADIAAIDQSRTGELKNAGYASVFSFCTKAASSIGMYICGFLVQIAGIISGATEQTPEAVSNIALLTFISGPIVIFCSVFVLRKYPVNRAYMQQIEQRIAANNG
ncbi:MAG: MFS transporter [Kiritimatiellales bacterium]